MRWSHVTFYVVLLGLTLRVINFVLSADNPLLYMPILDERYYIDAGKSISQGNWLNQGAGAFMDPAYSYFLGMIFFLFGDNLTTVRLIQILLDSLNIFLVYAIGAKIWNKPSGMTAAVCYAVYPVAFFYSLLILKTTLTITSLLGFIWLFLKALEVRRPHFWYILGALAGLMIYLRANLILIIPFTIFCILFLWRSLSPSVWGKMLVFLIGVTTLIAANGMRSYFAGKDLALFNTQGGRLLYSSNNPDNLTGRYNVPSFARPDPVLSEKDFHREAERRVGRALSPKDVSRYWRQKALQFLFENPAKALLMLYNKLKSMISNCEIPNNQSYYVAARFSPLTGWPLPCFAFIFALGIPGVVLGIKESNKVTVLLIPLLTIFITMLVFYSSSRFRMPAVPFLCIGMGICGSILINWFEERNWVKFGCVSSLIILLLSISILIPCPAQSGNDAYFLAKAYWKTGDVEKAFSIAMNGKDEYPDQVRFYNLLGMISLSEGMPNRAIMFYERGLKLQPHNADILYNMGLLYLSKSRPQDAMGFFQKSVSVEPRSSSLFYMGMAYENMNKKALAFESYSRYLDISKKKDDPRRLRAKHFLDRHRGKYGN